jgi:hypothetical protein
MRTIFFLAIAAVMALPAFGRSKDHTTIFPGLATVNIGADEAAAVNGIVRDRISRIENCGLVSEKSTAVAVQKSASNAKCADRACAARVAVNGKADRVIYGTVSRTTMKYDTRVSRDGAGKYLLAEQQKDRYVITLSLYDAAGGTVLAAITETAEVNAVKPAAERAAARLRPFFRPAEGDKKEKEKSSPGGGEKLSWYVHAAPSAFVPVGPFRSMAMAGAGCIVGGGAENLIVAGLRIGLQAGYYFVFPSGKTIRSHHAVALSALVGYRFALPKGFSLAPALGGGYFINILSRDAGEFQVPGFYRYTSARYYDPHFFLKLEAAYQIDDHWAVFLSPGYFIFLEKTSTGMMVTFDAGARYYF